MELITTDLKNVYINFSEAFGRDLQEYEQFNMSIKRNYIHLNENIKEIMDFVITIDDQFIFRYLTNTFILHNELVDKEKLFEMLDSILTDQIKDAVCARVEELYDVNLDESSDKSKVKNIELQFKDEHAKAIIKVGMLVKIILPLVSKFLEECVGKLDKDILLAVNLKYLNEFSERTNCNLFNKIYKLTESRLRTTQYSDIVIWNYLENLAIDINNMIKTINRVALIEIIPKLEYNRNMVSLLHVFINNQISYLFRSNFPVNFKPVYSKPNSDDGDTNMFDRYTDQQQDEGLTVIAKLNIRSTITTLETRYGRVDEEELLKYVQNLPTNKIQTNLLFMFVQKFSENDYELLYLVSKQEYMKLLILMERHCNFHNIITLKQFLTAVPHPPKRKVSLSKKFVTNLTTSSIYSELIIDKYSHIATKVVESGILLRIITNLSKNDFTHFETLEPLVTSPEEVALELITFLKSIT